MSRRPPMPRHVAADVLTTSRRRCCLCFGLQHDSAQRKGQIAHLDHDRSNHAPDNLAFLCLEHHDQYDSRTSQSKNLTPEEVKRYRSELLAFLSATYPPSDRQLAATFARAFDRPAFRTPFRSESSIPRFREAIAETIALINTGGSSPGTTIPSKHRVHDRKLKETLDNLVASLVA